jgi:hypothetical protein
MSRFKTDPGSYHGRGAGYPAPPRSDPGVRNYRTGLLKDTRIRTYTPSGSLDLLCDAWFL